MNAPAAEQKLCPYCAEKIKAAAVKCRHCGSSLAGGNRAATDTISSVATDRARITLRRRWLQFYFGSLICLVSFVLAFSRFDKSPGSGWFFLAVSYIGYRVAMKRPVECSFCGRRFTIPITKGSRRCKKCEVLHVVTWRP